MQNIPFVLHKYLKVNMFPPKNITMVTFLVLETVFGLIIDEFLIYWFSNNSDDECQDAKLQKKLVLEIKSLSFYILTFFSLCNDNIIALFFQMRFSFLIFEAFSTNCHVLVYIGP